MRKKNYTLAIHGGAGTIRRFVISSEQELAYKAALAEILYHGEQQLKNGANALEVAVTTVKALEDCPLFNAGKGAVFTTTLEHELDASVMDGKTLAAGAVAQVKHIRNPVLCAYEVLKSGQYVLLAGNGADEYARVHGLEMVPQSYYSTPERYEQVQKVNALDNMQLVLDHDAQLLKPGPPIDEMRKFGTVGAVACDLDGCLAAANSTGGLTGKQYGRIGDSAVIGAGCYADNRTAAVATTGTGETFIRANAAYDLCALMDYAGLDLETAAQRVIARQAAFDGKGGLIAVDAGGNIAMPFNTEGMYRGAVSSHFPLFTAIYCGE